MEYIRYAQAEELLRSYDTIKLLLDSLNIELQNNIKKENIDGDEEIISAMSLGIRGYDIVPPPKISSSDKTANAAIEYEKKIRNDKNGVIKEIKNDIIDVEWILAKIDIGLESLNPRRQEIIKKKYIQDLSWKTICDDMHNEKRYLQEERKEGMKSFIKISRISVKQYEKLIKMIRD